MWGKVSTLVSFGGCSHIHIQKARTSELGEKNVVAIQPECYKGPTKATIVTIRRGEILAKDAGIKRISRLPTGLSPVTGWKPVWLMILTSRTCVCCMKKLSMTGCNIDTCISRLEICPGGNVGKDRPWLNCCNKDAVDTSINWTNGVEHVQSKAIFWRWHLTFWGYNDEFTKFLGSINKYFTTTPSYDRYPELANSIVLHIKQNLKELSAELLWTCIFMK